MDCDVAPKRRVECRRLVLIELEAHRDVERDRLAFLAVDVDLLVGRRALDGILRQHERLHIDGIFLDARRQRILQVQARAQRRLVDAAAGAVNHDSHIPGIDVRHHRRQQDERDDEPDDQPEHAHESSGRYRCRRASRRNLTDDRRSPIELPMESLLIAIGAQQFPAGEAYQIVGWARSMNRTHQLGRAVEPPPVLRSGEAGRLLV